MDLLRKRKREPPKAEVWLIINYQYDELLQAKDAYDKAKLALRNAKQKLDEAQSARCNERRVFAHRAARDVIFVGRAHVLPFNVLFILRSESNGQCDGGTCTTPDGPVD